MSKPEYVFNPYDIEEVKAIQAKLQSLLEKIPVYADLNRNSGDYFSPDLDPVYLSLQETTEKLKNIQSEEQSANIRPLNVASKKVDQFYLNSRYILYACNTPPSLKEDTVLCGSIQPDSDFSIPFGTIVAIHNSDQIYSGMLGFEVVSSDIKLDHTHVYQILEVNKEFSISYVCPHHISFYPLFLPETFTSNNEWAVGKHVLFFIYSQNRLQSKTSSGIIVKTPSQRGDRLYTIKDDISNEEIECEPQFIASDTSCYPYEEENEEILNIVLRKVHSGKSVGPTLGEKVKKSKVTKPAKVTEKKEKKEKKIRQPKLSKEHLPAPERPSTPPTLCNPNQSLIQPSQNQASIQQLYPLSYQAMQNYQIIQSLQNPLLMQNIQTQILACSPEQRALIIQNGLQIQIPFNGGMIKYPITFQNSLNPNSDKSLDEQVIQQVQEQIQRLIQVHLQINAQYQTQYQIRYPLINPLDQDRSDQNRQDELLYNNDLLKDPNQKPGIQDITETEVQNTNETEIQNANETENQNANETEIQNNNETEIQNTNETEVQDNNE